MLKSRTLLWLLTLTTLLAACQAPGSSPNSQASGEGKKGGTLRIAWLGSPPKVLHLYPEPQVNGESLGDVASLFGASLIGFNWDTQDYDANPDYSLAKSMPTVSPDGKVVTFTLRDDVKWSDNHPLTAADFQFAWDNASKTENNWVGLDEVERIESFRTPDDKTIVVTLAEPLARFLAIGTASIITPVPKHVWEGKSWLDPIQNPEILLPTVVAGPYIPKEVTAEGVRMARNPSFWGKQPLIDEIRFVSGSPQTVLNLVKTNGADWAKNFPPAQYADAKRTSSLNVVEWSAITGQYRDVEFNLRRPILADHRVREALVRALNRKDFIQFEDDLAVEQYGFITAGNTKWLNNSIEKYGYDLDRAKQLLTEAGFTLDGGTLRDRSGQPVSLEIVYPTTSAPRQKMAAYIQQQWKQLGIDVVVTGLDFNVYMERSQSKQFDVVMGTWGAVLDPDDAKTWLKTNAPQNTTGYSNARVDEIIEQAKVEQNDQKRKELYDEMQKLVADDLPVFYTVTLKQFTAFDKRVGGVKSTKGGNLMTADNQFVGWYVEQ
jgi:peptide/nickel transport system substrate-binding protein